MQVDTHAPLWGEVFQPMTEIPDLIEQYEVKFSNPWLKFPTWSSNFSSRQMSKNDDFNVIVMIDHFFNASNMIFKCWR